MPATDTTPDTPAGLSQAAAQAFAANLSIRKAWLNSSAPLIQAVAFAAPTYTQGSATTVNLLGSATGLIRKFYLVVTGTLTTGAGTMNVNQPFGMTNLLSNITFTDLNTRVRHNTTGAHMHMIQAARRGWVPGASLQAAALTDNAQTYANVVGGSNGGVNWGVPGLAAAATWPPVGGFLSNMAPNLVTTVAKNFQWTWEIPVSYTDTDLRGCIWANQVTANNLLSCTINPNFFASTQPGAADVSGSGYTSSASAMGTLLPTLTNLKFTLYQDMFVQGPQDKNNNILLPQVDMAYSYNLLMVPAQALQANSDNVFFAAPNRQILSHMLFWDNYLYNTLPGGSDVTAIKIQIANSLVVRQMEPGILAYWTRNLLGTEMPTGSSGGTGTTKVDFTTYYIDTRRRPLNVQTSGNVGIYFNPNTVQGGAALNIGYEYLEIQSATFNAPGFGM